MVLVRHQPSGRNRAGATERAQPSGRNRAGATLRRDNENIKTTSDFHVRGVLASLPQCRLTRHRVSWARYPHYDRKYSVCQYVRKIYFWRAAFWRGNPCGASDKSLPCGTIQAGARPRRPSKERPFLCFASLLLPFVCRLRFAYFAKPRPQIPRRFLR